jgi:hypothetical protein
MLTAHLNLYGNKLIFLLLVLEFYGFSENNLIKLIVWTLPSTVNSFGRNSLVFVVIILSFMVPFIDLVLCKWSPEIDSFTLKPFFYRILISVTFPRCFHHTAASTIVNNKSKIFAIPNGILTQFQKQTIIVCYDIIIQRIFHSSRKSLCKQNNKI